MKNILPLALAAVLALHAGSELPAQPPAPPRPQREFRAAWIATVSNIDWPTSRTRTTAQQKAEMDAILNLAQQLRMNALVFQVRTECDAFYPSTIEPWSYYLTNLQGRAPNPVWDPLQYAIDGAHARGIELHAWFNPYRVSTNSSRASSFYAANHVTKTQPELVRTYGSFLWLDPGMQGTQDYSASVIEDVLNRYDVDGIHFDDYFYPYPQSGVAFDDAATYAAYTSGGGTLSLANWRRSSVNTFVKRIHDMIREKKPTVRFGISPFGIWQPGNPPGVTGTNAYATLYADSKLWLNSGWVDYFAPQLYWELNSTGQSYRLLTDWWVSQAPQGRHVWPGLAVYKMNNSSWPATEITGQIDYTRTKAPGASGNILFNWDYIRDNYNGIRTALATTYSAPALVPASTWLDNTPPAAPAPAVTSNASGTTISWTPQGTEPAFTFVVYTWRSGAWSHTILPQATRSYLVPNSNVTAPTHYAVSAVDRLGNESAVAVRAVAPGAEAWLVK